MKQKIKNYFFSGLVFIVPFVVTILLIVFILDKMGGVWEILFVNVPYLSILPFFVLKIIGLFVSLVLIIFIGYLGTSIVGRYIFDIPSKIVKHTPFVKNIYSSAKELTDTLFLNKSNFSRVILIEFLHKGQFTVGFVTSEEKWKINGDDAVTVFVPTSPNPTGGFFIIVKKEDTIETDLSVEEGLKLIVSSGMVFSRKGEINVKKNKKNN